MGDAISHKYGWWRTDAEAKDWRKYFRARERGFTGVLGDSIREFNRKEFNKYELTTREGDDNSFNKMAYDHRKLMQELRRKGYELEYCACPELTPEKGLLHIHGILRGKRFPSQKELSELWERIHNAPIVYISKPRSTQDCVNYMVKHMVKEYPEASKLGLRLMVSKGWMPRNWMIVQTVLKTATIAAIYMGRVKEEAWEFYSYTFANWCKGKATLPIPINGRTAVFYGQRIRIGGSDYGIEELGEYLMKSKHLIGG